MGFAVIWSGFKRKWVSFTTDVFFPSYLVCFGVDDLDIPVTSLLL